MRPARGLFLGIAIAAEVRNRAANVVVSYCVPRAKSSRRADMLSLHRPIPAAVSNVGIRSKDFQSLNSTPRSARPALTDLKSSLDLIRAPWRRAEQVTPLQPHGPQARC